MRSPEPMGIENRPFPLFLPGPIRHEGKGLGRAVITNGEKTTDWSKKLGMKSSSKGLVETEA